MEYTVLSVAPIVLVPFCAFVINAFFGRKLPRQGDWLAVSALFISFIYSCFIFGDFVFGKYAVGYHVHRVFNWIDLSYGTQKFVVPMGIYIDNMTAIMLLMVTGVATLIHLFSTYYMKGDSRYGKFFVYMNLFTSAMLGLVLSDNLLSIFIFWELMGFCSYSLIGFYQEKEASGNASIKAFMTTRVGDVLFLLGILAVWQVVGSVTLVDIYRVIGNGGFDGHVVMGIPLVTFAGYCLFAGTIGKSAQFPLQVWLPDAMKGPTPCSALIHAATMVAAGVYLGLRCYPILVVGDVTTFVATIGAITAFGAATIALIQTDLKAVLAFSTISQLGYMVLGIGVGAYNPAFMHLITHAIFKACLFLAAGSVIHSLHDHHTHQHVQEMPRMGGLRKKLPYTFYAMLFCSLAIAGIPFFSGFVSKDRILGDAIYWATQQDNPLAYIIPVLGFSAAFLTAFYMFRMMFLTFFGAPRDKELYEHTQKEGFSLNRNLPLILLSVFTLGIWFSGSFTGQGLIKIFPKPRYEWFQTLVESPKVERFGSYERDKWGQSPYLPAKRSWQQSEYDPNHGMNETQAHLVHSLHIYGALLSICVALLGILTAYMMYIKRAWNPGWWVSTFHRLTHALENKYFMDHFYINILIQKGLLKLNRGLAWFDMGVFDRFAIDGWEKVARVLYRFHGRFDNLVVDNLVDSTGVATRLMNVLLRTFQSGKLQFYLIVFIFVLSSYILMV